MNYGDRGQNEMKFMFEGSGGMNPTMINRNCVFT